MKKQGGSIARRSPGHPEPGIDAELIRLNYARRDTFDSHVSQVAGYAYVTDTHPVAGWVDNVVLDLPQIEAELGETGQAFGSQLVIGVGQAMTSVFDASSLRWPGRVSALESEVIQLRAELQELARTVNADREQDASFDAEMQALSRDANPEPAVEEGADVLNMTTVFDLLGLQE